LSLTRPTRLGQLILRNLITRKIFCTKHKSWYSPYTKILTISTPSRGQDSPYFFLNPKFLHSIFKSFYRIQCVCFILFPAGTSINSLDLIKWRIS
jgi:hypothetical protein